MTRAFKGFGFSGFGFSGSAIQGVGLNASIGTSVILTASAVDDPPIKAHSKTLNKITRAAEFFFEGLQLGLGSLPSSSKL